MKIPTTSSCMADHSIVGIITKSNTRATKLCTKICTMATSDNTDRKIYQLKLNDINCNIYCHIRFSANFDTYGIPSILQIAIITKFR